MLIVVYAKPSQKVKKNIKETLTGYASEETVEQKRIKQQAKAEAGYDVFFTTKENIKETDSDGIPIAIYIKNRKSLYKCY